MGEGCASPRANPLHLPLTDFFLCLIKHLSMSFISHNRSNKSLVTKKKYLCLFSFNIVILGIKGEHAATTGVDFLKLAAY